MNKELLKQYAERYETEEFLNGDPSWFMHQVSGDENQEGDTELILTGTCLGSCTLLKVRLRIPYTLTQQLCETAGVIGLFESIALEGLSDLGITLTICLTSHSQIHTDLTALTIEVVAQVINHFLTYTLGFAVANLMNSGISHVGIVLQFREL